MDFKDTYNEYYKYVYNFVFHRIGNHADTQDVVSETFIALWQNWANLDVSQSVKSYVFAIASHKLTDLLRRRYKLHIQINLNSLDIDQLTQTDESVSAGKQHYLTILDELIAKLPSREQKFVELRFKKNYTIRQVASELEVTENNAKVMQNRLIKKLQTLWEQMI